MGSGELLYSCPLKRHSSLLLPKHYGTGTWPCFYEANTLSVNSGGWKGITTLTVTDYLFVDLVYIYPWQACSAC